MEKITNGIKEYATKKITWTETISKPVPIEEQLANNEDFIFDPGDLPIDEMDPDEVEQLKLDQFRHWCIRNNIPDETTTYDSDREHYCYASDVVDYEAIIRGKKNTSNIVVTVLIDELEYEKADTINTTKLMLNEVLSTPKEIAGGVYTVTEEKQLRLVAELTKYNALKEVGTDYELKWNEHGQEAVVKTYEEMAALAVAISNYVTPIVDAQRTAEVDIKNATSKEGIANILAVYAAEIGYGITTSNEVQDNVNALATKIADSTKAKFEQQ